jgi:hypothetical protein
MKNNDLIFALQKIILNNCSLCLDIGDVFHPVSTCVTNTVDKQLKG